MTPIQMLDHIEKLTKTTPFSAQKVEKALSTTLNPEGGNEYFKQYAGTAAGGFTSLKLSEPQAGAANGGEVHLEVGDAPCVTFEMAKERFGFAHAVPTHPGHPKSELNFYQHQADWGKLIVGYDPNTGCLSTAFLRAK